MFYNKVYHSGQEHQHRNFVDGVHGAQVKIRFTVWVFLPEEIGGHFRKIKQSFHIIFSNRLG
jgi:hypothetical protein